MQCRRAGAAIAAALLVGCGGEEPIPPSAAIPTGPLVALPECGPPPPPSGGPVEGLIVPTGFVTTSVTPQGPLTQVTGWVPLTPVQVEVDLGAAEGVTVLSLENEIYEAEALLSRGGFRTYLKAAAMCQTASTLVAVVAREVEASGLPVPTGAASAVPAVSPTAVAPPPPSP